MRVATSDENRCQAIKPNGERCKLEAVNNDYCYTHDPERIQRVKDARLERERIYEENWGKGERLREIVEIIQNVCRARGWFLNVQHLDNINWSHVAIKIDKYFSSNLYNIGGNVELLYHI